MAQQDKATLKQAFQTGDGPTGSDFDNLIDSQLNLQEVTAQTILGAIVFSGGVTFSAVSAAVVGGNAASFSTLAATAASIVTLSATNIFGLARGECYAVSNGVIAVTALNSYVVTNSLTSAETAQIQQFTHNASGRLTYIGTATKSFAVDVDFSMTANTVLQAVEVRIGVNGTSQVKTGISFHVVTAASIGPISGHVGGFVTLTANSFIEVLAAATLNVSDITFTKLSLRVRELG